MAFMPTKPNKRALPFTLRLMPEERAILEHEAAGIPLGEYIRVRALDKNRVKRRARGKHPVKDHQLLAQLLGELGRMRVANNLNQLAKAVNSGSLALTPETTTAILEACADIREIKETIMQCLGREG